MLIKDLENESRKQQQNHQIPIMGILMFPSISFSIDDLGVQGCGLNSGCTHAVYLLHFSSFNVLYFSVLEQ